MTEVRIDKARTADPGLATVGFSRTIPAGTHLLNGLRAFDLRCAQGGAGTPGFKVWLVHRITELAGPTLDTDGNVQRDGYLYELLASGTFAFAGARAGAANATLVTTDLISSGVTLATATALDTHIASHYGKGVEAYNPGSGGAAAVRCRDFGNAYGIIAACWLASTGAKSLLNLST